MVDQIVSELFSTAEFQQKSCHNREQSSKNCCNYKSIPLGKSLPSGRRKTNETLNPTIQKPNLRFNWMRLAAHERFLLTGELRE